MSVRHTMPKHIAIIMDGNGRWAKKHLMPRMVGHKMGLAAVRKVVASCRKKGIGYLTLFAFSTENWLRPAEEVSFLMELFLRALENEVEKLAQNDIRLRVIGNRDTFGALLAKHIHLAEQRTAFNQGLVLTIAADYGGRWDILQAVNHLIHAGEHTITPSLLEERLALSYAPEPDLFIRTGGEQRISNFLLWQLAYTELFFTDLLWPDFDEEALEQAIVSYQQRERRFGRTSEQLGFHQKTEAENHAGT